MLRSLIANSATRSVVAARSLHTTPVAFKSVTETVKDAAKTANIKIGQKLAAGIEKGEQATESVQKTVGAKTEEASNTASHKADKAATGAKEAKEDFKKNIRE